MLILNNNVLEKLIELIYPNNAISNGVLSNQDYLSQQSFLHKKRNLENNYIIQKHENNHNPNKNNNNDQIKYYSDYYTENHLLSPNLINQEFNHINKFKFGDLSNYYNFIDNNNIIKQNFIKN